MLIKSVLNRAFLLATLCLIGLNVLGQKSIEVKQFDSQSGILQPFIYSINQDDQGYLWVGTSEGVFKYNGFNFEVLYEGDSLTENFITVGYTDSSGGIWWGHQSGGITQYKDGKFSSLKVETEFSSSVNSIKEDKEGNIWYALQSNGLVRYRDGKLKHYSNEFQDLNISDMEFAYNGLLLVGTDEGLFLYQIQKQGNPFKIMQVKDIPDGKISHVCKSHEPDTYWIGTEENGIYKIKVDPSTKGFIEVISIGEGYDLQDKIVRHILEDRSGNLWISTQEEGVLKASYSASTNSYIDVQQIGANYMLESTDINLVFEDREGNIWVGSHGGSLYYLIDHLFEQYVETVDTQTYKNILSIYVDTNYYYYGTEGKLIVEKKIDNSITVYDSLYGLPKTDSVTAIYIDKKGNYWLGTDQHGAYVMYKGEETFESLNLSLDKISNSVNSITGGDQFIYIATKFGMFQYNTITKDAVKLSTENQLKHNDISQLYKDPKTSTIWVATRSNYLSRIRGTEIKHYKIKETGNILDIISVCGDSNGDIWMATYGHGVYKFNTNRKEFVHFDLNNQLLSDYCYSLIVDDNDNVWIGHRGGISRIIPDKNMVKTYGPQNGFMGDCSKSAIFKDHDNNVWFGTNEGAYKFVQSKDKVNTIPPLTDLLKVIVSSGNSDTEYSGGPIELGYGNYKVRFEFIGLSFKNSNNVTYSYTLEGYETEWTELSTNNFAQYNNLADGDYVFKVKSCNSDGYCSIQSTDVEIRIATPIWKKWWFITLCVLLLIAAVFFYIRYREKRQRQIQEYLQTELDERTREVIEQKEELESKNKDITDSINYAKRIQRAVIPKYSELQRVLPNSYIYFKPRDIVSGDFYWMHKPDDDRFFMACADATGHGVPGAFMSLIGGTILQDAVRRSNVSTPQDILETLEKEVVSLLTSDGQEENPKDGMDISVIEINLKTKVLRICSAMRPVFVIKDGELHNLKANRNPIGGGYKNFEKSFEMTTVQLSEGDGIYMFTDGYPDQFGGPNGKKFKVSRLKAIFEESHNLSAEEQYARMDREFSLWTEGHRQIDDVLVIGIKL